MGRRIGIWSCTNHRIIDSVKVVDNNRAEGLIHQSRVKPTMYADLPTLFTGGAVCVSAATKNRRSEWYTNLTNVRLGKHIHCNTVEKICLITGLRYYV